MGWFRRLLGAGGRRRGQKASNAEARPFRRSSGLQDGLARHRDLTDRFCSKPWDHFEVHSNGAVYMCCPKWLPVVVGNCEKEEPMAIWNSAKSQAVRKGILDGSFRHCVQAECAMIQTDTLPFRDQVTDPRLRQIIDEGVVETGESPQVFSLCYDESCNLQCPSCRRNRIFFGDGPEYERRKRIQDMLFRGLFAEPHERHFRVLVTGSGDPFGSKLFRDLLMSIDGRDFPNVVIDLQTNGVLFTRANWDRIARLHDNIGTVMVSFDAATPETYAYTRLGGDWQALLQNVLMLGELRQRSRMQTLRLDFVVQQRNYREMPAFVTLARDLPGVDFVSFNLITDWGTYGRDFAEHAIWREDHADFDDFLSVLRDPVLAEQGVYLGNVSEYRRLALERS